MYKIGICDDDKILCSVLEEQIYELSKEIEIKAEIDVWYSGESIQNDLEKGMELDLLFLDIELVRKNGIAVGNFIRNEMENMQTHIVYISSKESYAMQLFKVQPLDFLIKPVSAENIREVLIRSVKQKSSGDTCFEYQKGNSVFRVPVRNIAYFMSMDKKIIIVKKVFLSADETEEKALKIGLGIYCLLTTTVYSIFGVSALYEICNGSGIIGLTCFYQEPWKKRLWVSLILFSLDMANSLIVLFVFGDIAKFQQPAVQALLMLICITIISHISYPPEAKEIAFDRKQTLLLLVIPAMSVIVLSVLMLGEPPKMFAFLISGCMLIINISVFYLYNVLIENYIHLRENDIYKQQTYAYQNQLEVIMESQNRVRALRHDMKNHILALQVLVQRKEVEETNQYLDSMKNFMTNPEEYVKTGNDTVDSLLNYKIQKANEVLNAVETKISIPEQLCLRSFDLNVLLGNLLDNAIDASMQTEDKKLKITIKLDKGILFLNICNSCQRIADRRSDFLETTKEDKVNHGIGLKNVRRIVEKYHGEIAYLYENDSMETDVMMYIKEM